MWKFIFPCYGLNGRVVIVKEISKWFKFLSRLFLRPDLSRVKPGVW